MGMEGGGESGEGFRNGFCAFAPYAHRGWAHLPQLSLFAPWPLEKQGSLQLGSKPISQLQMSTALLTAPDS